MASRPHDVKLGQALKHSKYGSSFKRAPLAELREMGFDFGAQLTSMDDHLLARLQIFKTVGPTSECLRTEVPLIIDGQQTCMT
jgi:hypothetical protein